MRATKKPVDHERERRVIDAAYGLVLGAFDGLGDADEAGYREWNKADVQAAAMDAARQFMDQIEPSK